MGIKEKATDLSFRSANMMKAETVGNVVATAFVIIVERHVFVTAMNMMLCHVVHKLYSIVFDDVVDNKKMIVE